MGEKQGNLRAPTQRAGATQQGGRIAWALVLANCLFVIPLGASTAQTNELAAEFRQAPDGASDLAPNLPPEIVPLEAEPTNFAAQFEGVIPSIEPSVGDLAIAVPSGAVDLDTFEPPREVKPKISVVRDLGTGVASYYGRRFHGRLTANGERFNMNAMTAAHKTLPFGTRVRVTNPRNGRSVTVRINDRGPFIRGRTIDLSRAAATRIGMISSGHARVKLDIVSAQ